MDHLDLYLSISDKREQALTFLTTVDQKRLKSVFEGAAPYPDVQSAHYSILGIKLLGGTLPNAADTCKTLQARVDAKSV